MSPWRRPDYRPKHVGEKYHNTNTWGESSAFSWFSINIMPSYLLADKMSISGFFFYLVSQYLEYSENQLHSRPNTFQILCSVSAALPATPDVPNNILKWCRRDETPHHTFILEAQQFLWGVCFVCVLVNFMYGIPNKWKSSLSKNFQNTSIHSSQQINPLFFFFSAFHSCGK